MATTFNLSNSFGFTDPDSLSSSVTPERGLQGDGIAYNAGTGNLFVIRTDAPSGPASRVQSVLEFTADGTYVGEFDFGSIGQVAVGGTVLPNGNLLIAALNPGANNTFATRLVEVTTTGTIVDNGIDITLPAEFNDRDQRGLVVGVTYSPGYDTNSRLRSKEDTVLVITSRSQEIVEFDLEGEIVASVDLSQYGVTAPQGLAINPATGNIFVADEATTSGGTNKIYEISPLRDELAVVGTNTQIPRFGSLVSIVETESEFGLTDPEGISFAADGTLYVVFDGDDANGSNLVANFLPTNPQTTTKLSIDESFTFDFSDGEGLAFRASDNTLFVLQASTTNGPVWNIFQYDTTGAQVGTEFTVDLGSFGPQDITVRSDNGNLILSGLNLGNFNQRFVEIDPATQTQAAGGIDFSFAAGFTSDVFSGVFYNPNTQTLFGTDYLDKSVKEYNPITGAIKTTNGIEHKWNVGSLISSQTLSPQAITYDQHTGHYFLAGDVDSGNLIYEVGLTFAANGTPTTRLYGVTNTELTLGIQDAEGLAIDPNTRTLYASFDNDRFDVQTFSSVPVEGIGGKVARATLSDPTAIPTLRTIDKFGVEGVPINLTLADFTTIPAQNFAPTVPAFSGGTLDSVVVLSLPSFGTLSLNETAVTIGQTIASTDLADLSYVSNPGFSGVDTFQVSASNGTDSSAPAHIDFFVSSSNASQLTAIDTFSIDLGVAGDDRFNNSADGLVFNPTTQKVYTASSFRINPTNPETIGWRLIESNPDGSQPRVILQSEATALSVTGQTPFTPLPNVPVLDLVADTQTDGTQDLAVVQGTGTARDGNILILSTRGALVREITPDGELVDGGINFDAPGVFELNGAFDRSAVGIVHAVENGQEYVYVTDFGERLIRKVPALTGTNADPAIVTEDQIVSEIFLQTALPESRLQDITIDALTGNFFVADDASGNASIYEITPTGTVLGATDMLALGQELGLEQGLSGQALTDFVNKFADLEGISIDPTTRTLYTAIDDDGVGQFGLEEIGRQVVAISLDADSLFATGTPGPDDLVPSSDSFIGVNSLVFTGAGNDTVDIPAGGANLGFNRLFTGSGSDIIYVADGDRAFGGSGDDEFDATLASGYRLSGGAGDDEFFLGVGGRALGGDGNDTFTVLEGGNNLLSGGAGADTFWILTDSAALLGSANTIVDYTIGTDVIGIANQIADSVDDLTLSGSNISLNGVLVATLNGVNAADATFVFGNPLA